MSPSDGMVFGWGATLILLIVVFAGVALFWLWWSRPNRGRGKGETDVEVDPTESKERLEMLRSARQWGDVSTTSETYLRIDDR